MVHQPKLILSELDRELIALLADIITRTPESGNETAELPALTNAEALHLLSLLEKLLEDRRFQNSAFFCQAIWLKENEKIARRIYSSMRRDLGKTVIMVSRDFGNLQKRLALPSRTFPPSSPKSFTFTEFIRYEIALFSEAGLDIRVRNVLTRFLTQCEKSLETERSQRTFSPSSPSNVIASTAEAIRLGVVKWKVGLDLTTPRYASLLTIITNASALFTTRDWTAIGVLSATAAVIGADLQASADQRRH